MFDLLLIVTLFITAVFAGGLSCIVLSQTKTTSGLLIVSRKILASIAIVIGILGGIVMLASTLAMAVISGEVITITRLLVSFIEGTVPMAIGILSGFAFCGKVVNHKK